MFQSRQINKGYELIALISGGKVQTYSYFVHQAEWCVLCLFPWELLVLERKKELTLRVMNSCYLENSLISIYIRRLYNIAIVLIRPLKSLYNCIELIFFNKMIQFYLNSKRGNQKAISCFDCFLRTAMLKWCGCFEHSVMILNTSPLVLKVTLFFPFQRRQKFKAWTNTGIIKLNTYILAFERQQLFVDS